jgi:hypothetical protein
MEGEERCDNIGNGARVVVKVMKNGVEVSQDRILLCLLLWYCRSYGITLQTILNRHACSTQMKVENLLFYSDSDIILIFHRKDGVSMNALDCFHLLHNPLLNPLFNPILYPLSRLL